MKFKRGFTLIEILLVVGIAVGIFAFSAPFGLNFYKTQLVEEARSNIVSALQEARRNAILQKNDSAFGVHIIKGSYTIFQGSTYASRIRELDQVFTISGDIDIDWPKTDVVFAKLTGQPSTTGTLSLSYGNIIEGIIINNSGILVKGEVDPDFVRPDDLDVPTVDSFSVPALSSSLIISINSFIATDNIYVTGYKITESATPPSAGATGWTDEAPTTYTFTTEGNKQLYAWAKDAEGNISASISDTIEVFNGLIAYWPFTGNADDYFGNSDGTVSGASLTTGLSDEENTGYSFDGVNDVINFSEDSVWYPGTDSYSVSIWVKYDETCTADDCAVTNFIGCRDLDIDSNDIGWAIGTYRNSGVDQVEVDFADGVNKTNFGAGTITRGAWTNFVLVRNKNTNTLVVYKDGIPVISRADTTGNVNNCTFSPVLGRYNTFFEGKLDEIRIYNRALSSAEISTLYQDNIPPADITAPEITEFVVPVFSYSKTVPITTFTATDNIYVTGYKITESNTPPSPDTIGWTATATTTYTFGSGGSKTLYAWVKDAGGNVSSSASDSVMIIDGLVSHWTFTGNANDIWGSNNGTVTGATLTTGVDGLTNTAYSFDGTGDYIDLGTNGITGNSAFTLSAWIKPDVVNKYSGAISIGSSGGGLSAYIGTVATAQAGTSNSIGGGIYGPNNFGTGITTINNWSFVVMTYSGGVNGTLKIYVDNVEKVSQTVHPNLSSATSKIGRIGTDTLYDFDGIIDEVQIFNQALTSEQIQLLYEANVDTVNPTVTAFVIPSFYTSLIVPITTFTATDNTNIAGYLLTESATAPLASATGWTTTAPTTYTFATAGSKTLYAWVKDSFGNVSNSLSDSTSSIVADCIGGGGVETTDGDYTICTFTSSGTFNVSSGGFVEALVVAAGGGGGSGYGNGAGGGAGGLVYNSSKSISSGTYDITIGQGGSGGSNSGSSGGVGGNSVFLDIVAIGGGGGGWFSPGGSGGSGGGGHWDRRGGGSALQSNSGGGLGYGNAGGSVGPSFYCLSGGGGGAGAAGDNADGQIGGNGGVGLEFTQFASVGGSPLGWFAGGGGSGRYTDNCGSPGGVGGLGGGADGRTGLSGLDAVANTGGGGAGGGTPPGGITNGGSGGSGIVILRY
jgi:type II secretory pathway pseudopilin PulG